MHPEILSKIVVDARFLILNKSCYQKKYLFYQYVVDKTQLLYNACRYGNTDIVEFFLKIFKIDPSKNDHLAIKLASKHENKEIVELLLQDSRVDPIKALDESIRNVRYEIIKLLLNKVNSKEHISTAFYMYRNTENDKNEKKLSHENANKICYLFLKHPENQTLKRKNYIFKYAAYFEHHEIFDKLINDKEIDVNYTEVLKFVVYCSNDKVEIIEKLIKLGADPAAYDNFALDWSIYFNTFKILELLLKQPSVNPLAQNCNLAFKILEYYGTEKFKYNENIVKLLMNHPKTNLSLYNNKLFLRIIESKNINMVKYMLDQLNYGKITLDKDDVINMLTASCDAKITKILLECKEFSKHIINNI